MPNQYAAGSFILPVSSFVKRGYFEHDNFEGHRFTELKFRQCFNSTRKQEQGKPNKLVPNNQSLFEI